MTEPRKPKLIDRVLSWVDDNSKLLANMATSWLIYTPPIIRKLIALVVNKLIDVGVMKLESFVDAKRDKKAIERILAANASNAPLDLDALDPDERDILEGKRN